MKTTNLDARSIYPRVFTVTLLLVIALRTASAFSQQTIVSPAPAEIDLTSVRPGVWCQMWLKTSSPRDPDSKPDEEGTVKEVTKDEIVVGRIIEGRNEYRTPVLGYLPYVGKLFTRVYIGRGETISRVPIEKIATIKILPPVK